MQIIRIDETPSSNNYASNYIAMQEVAEGTVFLAHHQTDGRGQGTNRWESESGSNLTFSLVLLPRFLSPADQFWLSQVVALGIADFLIRVVPGVSIKWPNDMLIERKKIAGILIEHTVAGNALKHTIAGVGLNINQIQFARYIPEATSLALTTGNFYNTEAILSELYGTIMSRYTQLQMGDIRGLQNDYMGHLYGFGLSCRFMTGERTFEGKIRGTDRFGRLLVEESDCTLNYWQFKEIALLWD